MMREQKEGECTRKEEGVLMLCEVLNGLFSYYTYCSLTCYLFAKYLVLSWFDS